MDNWIDMVNQALLVTLVKFILLRAISEGYLDYFKKWNSYAATLNKQLDLSEHCCYPFMKAIENGQHSIAKYMIEELSVDPSTCYNQALTIACSKGDLKMVKLLIKDERVIEGEFHEPSEPFSNAFCGGSIEIVKILLSVSNFKIPLPEELMKVAYTSSEILQMLLLDLRTNKDLGQERLVRYNSLSQERLGRYNSLSHEIIKRKLTCCSDHSLYHNEELCKLVLSDPEFVLEKEVAIKYVDLAFKNRKTSTLKLLLRHPVLKDFDYYAFKDGLIASGFNI